MRQWIAGLLLALSGLLGLAAPAAATVGGDDGNPFNNLKVEVTPTAPSFSVSVAPEVNFVAYQVKVTNIAGVTVQGIAVYGVASVDGVVPVTNPLQPGGACVAGNFLGWLVKCEVGNLPPGGVAEFTVVFRSPPSGAEFRLSWGAGSFIPPSIEAGASTVALTTQTSTEIASGFQTAVPTSGGVFYTGAFGGVGSPSSPGVGSVATRNDPITTTIVVPAIAAPTTASVAEQVVPESCSPSITQCYESALKIPGTTFPATPLTIYLRIDATRIAFRASIGNAKIFYTPTDSGVATFVEVPLCSVSGGPTSGNPCIAERRRYSTAPLGGSSSDWVGDWEFKILAFDNGRYRN
jgi:hypothetical protein